MRKGYRFYYDEEPIIMQIVRKTNCLTCGATYGLPCRQPSGKRLVIPHINRVLNQLKNEKHYGYKNNRFIANSS
jgi:hypothetical protein